MSSIPENILNPNEEPEVWPSYDSTHTFKYSNFSVTEKEKLFKLISKYYVYCNKKDTKAISVFVGTTKNIFNNIINYLFASCTNATWSKKYKIRIDYSLFQKEYLTYIKNITEETDDSYIVNKIFNEITTNSINNLSKEAKSKLCLDILKEYDTIHNDKYDIEAIKKIAYKIIEEDLKLEKPNYQKMNWFFKNFNKFIASLTINDFPNINKIRNLQGYKYPNCYVVEIDEEDELDKKEINIIPKKRDRDNSKIDVQSNVSKKSRKSKEINIISGFLDKISDNTYQDVVLLRKMIEDKQKKEEISNQSMLPLLSDDNKKEFIKTLPSNVFVLLKSKGGINYSGFIKSVQLTTEEELQITTDILMKLHENGFIIE
jgi:hypothetical protein